MSAPTEKQVGYAMLLLGRAGYSTDYMDRTFKALGAGMRDRSGTVEGWVESLGRQGVSNLIDKLLAELQESEGASA